MAKRNEAGCDKIVQRIDDAELTEHARRRMQHRAISAAAIEAVLEYGRRIYTRGAVIYAVGRKEISKHRKANADLESCNGIQVVCSLDDSVITVYRNRTFKGLRPGLGCKRRRGHHDASNAYIGEL